MTERRATAEWKGGLMDGSGSMKLGSGMFEGKFSFQTRMGDEPISADLQNSPPF